MIRIHWMKYILEQNIVLKEQHELANVEREFEINNIVVKPEGKWIYREALDARKTNCMYK